jgi:hypothetical protein
MWKMVSQVLRKVLVLRQMLEIVQIFTSEVQHGREVAEEFSSVMGSISP